MILSFLDNTFRRRWIPVAVSSFFFMSSPVAASPLHSEPDTVASSLDELTVTASSPAIVKSGKRSIQLSAGNLGSLPMLAGTPDAIRMMQSLPGVSSNSELAGGLYVQGCDNSSNLTTVAGHRIINPMHILGLFPAFNNSHFSSYSLQTIPTGPQSYNVAGAVIEATPASVAPQRVKADLTVGLLNSQASVAVPFAAGKGFAAVAARASYLGLILKDGLPLDRNRLKYDFDDANLSLVYDIGKGYTIAAEAFHSGDRTNLINADYASENRLSWFNTTAGISLYNDHWHHRVAISDYRNSLLITEGEISRRLHSSHLQTAYSLLWNHKDFYIGFDANVANYRHQTLNTLSTSGESDVYVIYERTLSERFRISPGVRFLTYFTSGFRFFRPLPQLVLDWMPADRFTLTASYASLAQTSLLVKESAAALPIDMWTAAGRHIRPMESNALSLKGSYEIAGFYLSLEAYYRNIRHQPEFRGSIISMLNHNYDPLADTESSGGHAGGASLMIARSVGPVRGWLTYNFGHSRLRFDDSDDDYWFPSSHDRTHDLKANLSWRIGRHIEIGASWTLASGYPYTKPKYGYLIGENLICEYYPHNSARMPRYMRLDLSANFIISDSPRLRQQLNVSLYNALFSKNVLFITSKWSPDKGFETSETSLGTAIPSISYTLTLK